MAYPEEAKTTLEKRWINLWPNARAGNAEACKFNIDEMSKLIDILIAERDCHYENWKSAEKAYQQVDKERSLLKEKIYGLTMNSNPYQ